MNAILPSPRRTADVHRQIVNLTIYPVSILLAACALALYVCANAAPLLTDLYAALHTRFPFLVQMLVGIGWFARENAGALLVLLVAVTASGAWWLRGRVDGFRLRTGALRVLLLAVTLPLFTGCESTLRSKYNQGYAQASGDSIKRNYWTRHELEQRTYTYDDEGRKAYYTLPGPTKAPDGTLLSPHPITVPIDE